MPAWRVVHPVRGRRRTHPPSVSAAAGADAALRLDYIDGCVPSSPTQPPEIILQGTPTSLNPHPPPPSLCCQRQQTGIGVPRPNFQYYWQRGVHSESGAGGHVRVTREQQGCRDMYELHSRRTPRRRHRTSGVRFRLQEDLLRQGGMRRGKVHSGLAHA